MSDLGWQLRGFLNLLGLDPRHGGALPKKIELAEAGIDPRTGGAVAITTKAFTDGKDGVQHVKTYYWRMLPNGEQLSSKLFDLEFERGEALATRPDGSQVMVPMMLPRAAWVLGRKVPCGVDDEDDDDALGIAEVLQLNLSRLMSAVGKVNHQLRQGALPNIAEILDECGMHEVLGESLTVSGQSAQGGFDFDLPLGGVAHPPESVTVPDAVGRALIGFGVNNLDRHQKLRSQPRRSICSKTGNDYLIDVHAKEGVHPRVWTGIEKLVGPTSEAVMPCLTAFKWRSDNQGNLSLKSQNLLGEDMRGADWLRQMQAMGATNRMMHDARNGDYAATIDHLIEYDLHDLVQHYTPPPPLAKGGRLTMISAGGNNMEEVADGFGDQIGGNSKVVYHEGLDNKGKVSRVGVIIDLGLHLSPKDEPNKWAAPDVIEHLKHCNDILITHRHLDHTDGLFAYMQYGYLRGKTIHATPEVIRSIRDKISTYPTIHRDDWPAFEAIKGEGWLHVKDKEGNARISVNYARNATPHSARTTPFIVHGHYRGKWIGSYLNHGDARFGSHNAEDYKGKPVDVDHLNKAFFTQSNANFLAEMQRLDARTAKKFDPAIAQRNPTYFDMDITSIQKKGWAPTEHAVEDNLHELAYWFRDKGMLLGMISTNDNRFETATRVANRAHRDMTVFGANLQKTATTMNVLGLNDLRYEPQERGNIQFGMDADFEARLTKKIADYKDRRAATAADEEKAKLTTKIDRHEARLEAFQELRTIGNAKRRYVKRMEKEAELEARFGRETTLGSIAADHDDELELGAIHVGRTSQTARAIMGMEAEGLPVGEDGRRLVLLTGTQGSNAEVDAALVALSEGRHSVLNGNAKNSHTARPIVPESNIVVISQSAIPGNDRKQDELVRKLVGQGFTVVQAIHDGFKIHNMDAAHCAIVTQGLQKLGKRPELEEGSGALVVTGMPIHAGGHGHEKDCEAWVTLVKADVTAAQHTSDPKGGQILQGLCAQHGSRFMDRVVPNFEGISMEAGDSPAQATITSIGRGVASIISGETVRQQRKAHGGHIVARQLVRPDFAAGMRFDGLLANQKPEGFYARAFAGVDAEALARSLSTRTGQRPVPVPENRTTPFAPRPDEGMRYTSQQFRHALFGERIDDSCGLRKS